jgi:hypothetical protein
MPSYTAPLKDMQFVLHEVLKLPEAGIAGYEDLDAEFTGAILEEAGRFASEVLAPAERGGRPRGLSCSRTEWCGRRRASAKPSISCARQGWPAIDCDPKPMEVRACPTS